MFLICMNVSAEVIISVLLGFRIRYSEYSSETVVLIRVCSVEQRCDFQSNFLIVLIGFAIAFGLATNGVVEMFVRIKLILKFFVFKYG